MNPLASIKDNELTHELWLRGKALALADRDWIVVEQQRLIVLETLASSYTGESVAASERRARTSPEYAAHIEKMGDTRSEFMLAKARYAAIDHEIRMRINNSFRQQAEYKAGNIVT